SKLASPASEIAAGGSTRPLCCGAKRSSRVDAAPRGGRGDTETVVNAHFWIMRLLDLIFVTLSSEIFESDRDFLEPLGATYIFHCERGRNGRVKRDRTRTGSRSWLIFELFHHAPQKCLRLRNALLELAADACRLLWRDDLAFLAIEQHSARCLRICR